jgi:hypothetical protein
VDNTSSYSYGPEFEFHHADRVSYLKVLLSSSGPPRTLWDRASSCDIFMKLWFRNRRTIRRTVSRVRKASLNNHSPNGTVEFLAFTLRYNILRSCPGLRKSWVQTREFYRHWSFCGFRQMLQASTGVLRPITPRLLLATSVALRYSLNTYHATLYDAVLTTVTRITKTNDVSKHSTLTMGAFSEAHKERV